MNKDKKQIALVIGDIMLDVTYYGMVERVSPEAPCPIFNQQSIAESRLGGAGYVANQLAALNVEVHLCGIIAKDKSGQRINELAEESSIDTTLVFDSGKITTTKTRYVAGEQKQQVFRVDAEQYHSFNALERESIHSYIRTHERALSYVLFVDYDKGAIDEEFCQSTILICKELSIPTFVDIKSPSFTKYKNAETVKGNRHEISRMMSVLGLTDGNYVEIKNKLACGNLIITCGSRGITYVTSDNAINHDVAISRNLYDVTGAGDVVSAFYVASILSGASVPKAIANANRAASLKVSRFGCPTLSWEDLSTHNKKLVSVKELVSIIPREKSIVFTNGCFDIIHTGHIDLLNAASSYGDILVVGLNSDKSIKRLKGPNRPINDLESRVSVLSALECVNFIVVFDDDTPLSIIQELRPSVLVKGGDYTKDQIVGADFVEEHGGQVRIVPIIHNVSSTTIVNRLT